MLKLELLLRLTKSFNRFELAKGAGEGGKQKRKIHQGLYHTFNSLSLENPQRRHKFVAPINHFLVPKSVARCALKCIF